MIGMIRALQIILHLPMFRILLPGNVTMIFQIIVPVAMFDIVDEEYFALFFNFDTVNAVKNNE